jgi:hypothetical protein
MIEIIRLHFLSRLEKHIDNHEQMFYTGVCEHSVNKTDVQIGERRRV